MAICAAILRMEMLRDNLGKSTKKIIEVNMWESRPITIIEMKRVMRYEGRGRDNGNEIKCHQPVNSHLTWGYETK